MIALMMSIIASFMLAGCGSGASPSRGEVPIPYKLIGRMQLLGVTPASPVLIRIFKQEKELEIWKQADDGRFALLKTYPICRWSGKLGPKLRQGDKQAPEGFYTVAMRQLNPHSNYHLSFNIGFPNALDRSYHRTGNYIMVHGDCRSAGCYAMTDALIEEIYAVVRDALRGGQKSFQLHAFPFRMTDENMAKHKNSRWMEFWRNLKKGYDAFEATHIAPKIDVCGRRYVINADFGSSQERLRPDQSCPAHRNFIPEIMETPEGPKIIQSYMDQPAPASGRNRATIGRHPNAG